MLRRHVARRLPPSRTRRSCFFAPIWGFSCPNGCFSAPRHAFLQAFPRVSQALPPVFEPPWGSREAVVNRNHFSVGVKGFRRRNQGFEHVFSGFSELIAGFSTGFGAKSVSDNRVFGSDILPATFRGRQRVRAKIREGPKKYHVPYRGGTCLPVQAWGRSGQRGARVTNVDGFAF